MMHLNLNKHMCLVGIMLDTQLWNLLLKLIKVTDQLIFYEISGAFRISWLGQVETSTG